jgi:anti-anti-sigma factor
MPRTQEAYLCARLARLDEQAGLPFNDIYQVSRSNGFRLLRGRPDSSPDCLLVRGDLDLNTERHLKDSLDSLRTSTRPLVIDLKRVTYISCASLRVLIHSQRELGKVRNVALDLGESGPVRQLIRHFELERHLPLIDSSSDKLECVDKFPQRRSPAEAPWELEQIPW